MSQRFGTPLNNNQELTSLFVANPSILTWMSPKILELLKKGKFYLIPLNYLGMPTFWMMMMMMMMTMMMMMMIPVLVVWYDAVETEHDYLASAENTNQLLICLSFGKSQACAHLLVT